MYPVAIEGPRVTLRELTVDDVESLAKVTADPAALEHMPFDVLSPTEADEFVEQLVDAAVDPNRFLYALAIVRNSDQHLLGLAQLSIESFTHRRAELGYLIGSEYWGNGFGREAAELVTNFGFDHLGLSRIWAVASTQNQSSERLLHALDFSAEGTLRRHLLISGEWHDATLYARVNDAQAL